MKSKVVAVLQARMSSARLPGKVLMPILGEPVLFRQIERLWRCREVDQLIVATSTATSDDALAEACIRRNVVCFRGSLEDVLQRIVHAVKPYEPDTVVRLTGDCPLADPVVIDTVIRFFYDGRYDYASNCSPPTFPDGLDVEVMRLSCLQEAELEAVLPSHREHVTPFLRAHPERYRLGNYATDPDQSHFRWTLDELEDFEFVRQVYEHLYPRNPNFSTEEVFTLLRCQPDLKHINARYKRNAGARKSLMADARFLSDKSRV